MLFFVILSTISAVFAADPVTTNCSEIERGEFYFPQSDWSEPKNISQAMVCSTMDNLMRMSRQALSEIRRVRGSNNASPAVVKTPISFECWKAVAGFWSNARPDKVPHGLGNSVEFLRTEMNAFIDAMNVEPPAKSSDPNACYKFNAPISDLEGHLESMREAMAQRLGELRCNGQQANDELEKWAALKLSSHYGSPIYKQCFVAGKTKLESLRACEKLRLELFKKLKTRFKSQDFVTNDDCINDVARLSDAPKDWGETQKSCTGEFRAQMAEEGKAIVLTECNGDARKCDGRFNVKVRKFNQRFETCESVHRECTELVASGAESQLSHLCPLPKGIGRQTAGTCAFHALSAASYMSSRGCPNAGEGKLFSVGQLQNYAGFEQGWTGSSGLNGDKVPLLKRNMKSRGVIVEDKDLRHAKPPLIVSAKVGVIDGALTNEKYNGALITSKEAETAEIIRARNLCLRQKDQSECDAPGYHALLVTAVVTTKDDRGRETKMAIVRDANSGYKAYFVPYDLLLNSNQYFGSVSCQNGHDADNPNMGCLSSALEVRSK